MVQHEFTVIIERDEDGFLVADVPELEGCHTQAKTMDKLLDRVKEVIELCLEERDAEKEKVPVMEFVGVQKVKV